MQVLRRLRHHPGALIALGLLALVVVVALLAPWLAPYDPAEKDFAAALQGPTAEHWLGTDAYGRDVLSRLIYGARIALVIALGSVVVAMAIGVPIGLLLGFRGGWWDRIGSRGMDVAQALPGMLVGFAVIAILGRGLTNLMIAIGLIFCMNFARMTRAVTLVEREKLYVDAARVSGLRSSDIVFRQVLPNLAGPLVVQAAVFMGAAIMVESALSFLGLGLESDVATWGAMLSDAAQDQGVQPFVPFPPGIAIVLTVLAFNLVGDGLNDALAGERATSPSRRERARAARAAAAAIAAADAEAAARAAKAGGAPVVTDPDTLLDVRQVSVGLGRPNGTVVPLVRDVDLTVRKGEILGLLGESGSGKSMLARSVLGLLPPGIRLTQGQVVLEGRDIAHSTERELRDVRGPQLGAVFQNPGAALSPVHTIGRQLAEPLRAHQRMSRKQARARSAELLERVGVDEPHRRLDQYPHEFSGGMAQRVAIAMALASEPELLIADEATSALDVTTQAQVLDLLLDLREETGMAIVMITHDLGVVAESCDRVAVMYAGEIVEVAEVGELFARPKHPYTAALLASNPSGDADVERLPTIPGTVPMAGSWPAGCHFASRCAFATEKCTDRPIPFVDGARCIRTDELTLTGAPR
ncbi:UNVERIFIED_CONTAM: hypothetical protein LK11_31915 [Mumia flava]